MNQLKEFFEYIFNAIKIWIIIQPWEQGIRVRNGKTIKKLVGGIYFRIPYIDSVYVQECRLRIVNLGMQTLTTKDGKTVTINSVLGYSIEDIEKLYQTLFHPETTVASMAMAEISDYVYANDLSDISSNSIEKACVAKLSGSEFGLKFEHLKLTNFAAVRTFRLIQDQQSWISNDVEMNKKK